MIVQVQALLDGSKVVVAQTTCADLSQANAWARPYVEELRQRWPDSAPQVEHVTTRFDMEERKGLTALFSLQCTNCDADGPGTRIEAYRRGWRRIEYHDGSSWNFLGECPKCIAEGAFDD